MFNFWKKKKTAKKPEVTSAKPVDYRHLADIFERETGLHIDHPERFVEFQCDDDGDNPNDMRYFGITKGEFGGVIGIGEHFVWARLF